MILITAYQQVKLTRENIVNFRNNFKGFASQCPIVVVTTSESDVGFKKLEDEFENVYVIEFKNSPGSSNCKWYTFKDPNNKPISWVHEFLPPRILMSIEKGLKMGLELGCNKVLHLHSDTSWQVSHEKNLNDSFDMLDEYMLMGDRSIKDCNSGPLPYGLHFHPEGLFFNLKKCKEYNNYGLSYSKIFSLDSSFRSHNYYAPSALIGQYALWCITNQNIIDTSIDIPDEYWGNVKIIFERDYHGTFNHGITNRSGKQPVGK